MAEKKEFLPPHEWVNVDSGYAPFAEYSHNNTAEVQVKYWGGFTGRAEPVMMILEEAKQPWKWDKQTGATWTEFKNKTASPVFALPTITMGNTVLSQTTAICAKLGKDFGLYPEAKDEFTVWSVALNIADLWAEAYKGRKGGAEASKSFLDGRLKPWLQVLAKGVGSEGQFSCGYKDPTYVDFLFLNAIRTVDFMFGKAFTDVFAEFNGLVKLREAMEQREGVKSYYKKVTDPVLYGGVKAA